MRCPWNTCFLGTKGRKYTKMKRLLAFVFVVTLAFSFAGSASAFSWEKPAPPDPEKIGYSIDVLKCTLVTGAAGSYYYNVDDNAVAVNGADVYWAVKLTVDGPADLIQSTAYADVEISGLGLSSFKAIPLSGLDSGVYYFIPSGAGGYFQDIETILANGGHSPVQATRCTDTQTAKVTARVYSERVLGDAFNVGDYDVRLHPLYTEIKNMAKEENSSPYIAQGSEDDGNCYYYTAEGGAELIAAYKGESGKYNPNNQFWFHGNVKGTNTWYNGTSSALVQIFEVGGCCFIAGELQPGEKMNITVGPFEEWLKDPNTLRSIKNAKGEPIPGLSVNIEPVTYTYETKSGTKETKTVHVYTFSSTDPSYNWDEPGNNIVIHNYQGTYPGKESERTMLVTFYQAANPVGTGPAIAQFVLNGDRQVQAVITSEAQWNEYFAAYIQEDDDLEKPDSGTGGTYLRVADQRPTFLGDMDAIFDLMAWLDEGEIDSIFDAIDAGEMYMTDENLWEALGYAYRFEDSISWAASTVPIIVDPLA